MSTWVQYLPLILVVVAFWFLVLRPARNRQKDFQATQNSLAPGARVMLASGIFGELVTVGEQEVELRIAPDTIITAARQAVAKVVEPGDLPPADEAVDEPRDRD